MNETTEETPTKKRKKSTSPTKLTLDRLRKQGITVQVVEYWNSFAKPFGRRVDLFGCIDIIALTPEGILGIQTTAASGHAARRTKTLLEPRIKEWLDSGGRFEIWSWKKNGNRWEVRIEDLASAVHAHAAHVAARSGSATLPEGDGA